MVPGVRMRTERLPMSSLSCQGQLLRSNVALRFHLQRRRVARQPAVVLFLFLALILRSARYDHVVGWRRTGGGWGAEVRGLRALQQYHTASAVPTRAACYELHRDMPLNVLH